MSSVQVMERTLPDSGKGLAEWWSQHGAHDESFTSKTYAELIERAGPAGERHASTVSISLDMKAAARAIKAAGGGNRGAAAVLRQEMATVTAALRAADLSPSAWLEPGDLAVILRSAYDPVVAGALERHGDMGRDLATAGPVAVSENWSSVRSDSAHHCVLWISEWPRSLVYPGFLAPVLLSSGVRRTFTLLYTPLRTDQAARDIRKKKTEYISDASQRQRIGQTRQHVEQRRLAAPGLADHRRELAGVDLQVYSLQRREGSRGGLERLHHAAHLHEVPVTVAVGARRDRRDRAALSRTISEPTREHRLYSLAPAPAPAFLGVRPSMAAFGAQAQPDATTPYGEAGTTAWGGAYRMVPLTRVG
jgi:hypothetical protein